MTTDDLDRIFSELTQRNERLDHQLNRILATAGVSEAQFMLLANQATNVPKNEAQRHREQCSRATGTDISWTELCRRTETQHKNNSSAAPARHWLRA